MPLTIGKRPSEWRTETQFILGQHVSAGHSWSWICAVSAPEEECPLKTRWAYDKLYFNATLRFLHQLLFHQCPPVLLYQQPQTTVHVFDNSICSKYTLRLWRFFNCWPLWETKLDWEAEYKYNKPTIPPSSEMHRKKHRDILANCSSMSHLPNIPIPSIKASMVYGNPRALPLVPGGNITSLGCAFLHSTY